VRDTLSAVKTGAVRGVWKARGRTPSGLRWLAVVSWAALIFLLSNQPGLHASEDPGVDGPLRHVAHVVVYAVLTVLIGWAMSGRHPPSTRVATGAAAIALLYGVTDEWHQTFVPSRSGRPEDLLWDGIGVILGACLLILASRLIRGSQSHAAPVMRERSETPK